MYETIKKLNIKQNPLHYIFSFKVFIPKAPVGVIFLPELK